MCMIVPWGIPRGQAVTGQIDQLHMSSFGLNLHGSYRVVRMHAKNSSRIKIQFSLPLKECLVAKHCLPRSSSAL